MSVTNAGGGSFAPSEYVGVCLKKTVPRRFLAQVRVGWPRGAGHTEPAPGTRREVRAALPWACEQPVPAPCPLHPGRAHTSYHPEPGG